MLFWIAGTKTSGTLYSVIQSHTHTHTELRITKAVHWPSTQSEHWQLCGWIHHKTLSIRTCRVFCSVLPLYRFTDCRSQVRGTDDKIMSAAEIQLNDYATKTGGSHLDQQMRSWSLRVQDFMVLLRLPAQIGFLAYPNCLQIDFRKSEQQKPP